MKTDLPAHLSAQQLAGLVESVGVQRLLRHVVGPPENSRIDLSPVGAGRILFAVPPARRTTDWERLVAFTSARPAAA